MPTYMFQESCTSEAWAVQVKNPQNRMEDYAFGEDDVVLIAELPDNVSAATMALMVSADGAAKAFKTTVLLSVDEVLEAMRRAGSSVYRPPGR